MTCGDEIASLLFCSVVIVVVVVGGVVNIVGVCVFVGYGVHGVVVDVW